jgi:ankyrin repeat protein
VQQPGFDINHPQLALNQPLLCSAAAGGLIRVAEFALHHGANPDITEPNGPPLILAAKAGHNSVVNLLCQRGASVQLRFGSMNSLDQAVARRDAKVVKTLIKHGADVNVTAACDSTHPVAVLQAAVLGYCDIVQLLLDAGATLDAELQYEAVAECCKRRQDATAVQIVKLLLQRCIRLSSENCELGCKMLAIAMGNDKLQVACVLHAAGADVHHQAGLSGTLMHSAAAGAV